MDIPQKIFKEKMLELLQMLILLMEEYVIQSDQEH